jgi:hypothetical protein
MYKDLVRTSQATYYCPATNISPFMWYKRMVAVRAKEHTKHISTLYGQNVKGISVTKFGCIPEIPLKISTRPLDILAVFPVPVGQWNSTFSSDRVPHKKQRQVSIIWKEEKKIVRVPDGGLILRQAGRLTVSRKLTLTDSFSTSIIESASGYPAGSFIY